MKNVKKFIHHTSFGSIAFSVHSCSSLFISIPCSSLFLLCLSCLSILSPRHFLFFAPCYSSFGSKTDNAYYVDSPRFQKIAKGVPVQEHLCSSPRFFTPNINSSTTSEVFPFLQFSFHVVCGLLAIFHKRRNIPVTPKSMRIFFTERN